MASITVRKLDDDVKIRLRVRAAGNGRSMEEEARVILGDAVRGDTGERDVVSIIRSYWTCERRGAAIASARSPARTLFLRLKSSPT